MNKNSLQELLFSFAYGAAVQMAVFKTAAKNVQVVVVEVADAPEQPRVNNLDIPLLNQ